MTRSIGLKLQNERPQTRELGGITLVMVVVILSD